MKKIKVEFIELLNNKDHSQQEKALQIINIMDNNFENDNQKILFLINSLIDLNTINKELINKIQELFILNHSKLKEIDYLNDYINDLEKYN